MLMDKIAVKLKEAMLARDEFLTTTLRGLKSAILNEEIAQGKRDTGLSDNEIENIIAREVKKRDDAIELYTNAGDKARAEKEIAECEILMEFLPEPLSEEDLKEVIERVIEATGAKTAADIGRTIGAIKAEVGTRGDGAVIAKIVKEKLTQ